MIPRWWERFSGRLEEELEALQAAGMPATVDRDWESRGVIRLEFVYETDDETIPLYAIYPDLFPYTRPQVYSADLDLARHRNPFAGNLCLIGRSTENWSTHDRLAEVVVEQIPHLLAAARRPEGELAPVPEESQAEPITGYLPWARRAVVLVDSAWEVPDGARSGTLTITAEVAHFAELAMPVRAKWPPWIGVLATPSEAASAADAGRPLHPLILTSSRCVAGPMAG